jgi:hypothetical protein
VSSTAETIERIRAAQQERKIRQRTKPRCEVCLKKLAVSFSRFRDGQWLYTCYCTTDFEVYYVMIDEYRASQAARDRWDHHLAGKSEWFNTDGFHQAVCRWLDVGGRMR